MFVNPSENLEEELFQKCLELPAEEREAFVETACGEDKKLRARVLVLLESHEKAGGFFDSLIDEDSAAIARRLERIAPSEESEGDQIGRYKLLEQLGEGAWGTVWMAQQTEGIQRKVALKILKLGLDTKDFLARFEAERQMLAMMDHPNIARVIDAGATDYGRPYMVMELVKGMPLLEYADKNRLSIAERVELFTKICSALQHAHEKGVIHRDLKPSNILVSKQGDEVVPKVIDFGVAKTNQFNLTDKTLFTSIHTFIGTPVYSSPEQLEFTGMDVDPRSDVYSLGVLLYELLCGSTPFDYDGLTKEGMEAFRTIVREKEPLRPSFRFGNLSLKEQSAVADARSTSPVKLTSILTKELDWIVIKCLEKDRGRRFDSAEILATDLQAYLEGRPVSAAAPSSTYRIRKFITRERPKYAIGLEVAAVLLAVLALFLFFRAPQDSPSPLATRPSSSAEAVSSIAVLPFFTRNAEVDGLDFADAVHEDVLNNLSRIDGLEMVSRITMMRYSVSEMTLRQIGRDLAVSYIVAGSVRKIDTHVLVSVQLIDALNDRQVWASNFQGELVDAFTTQSKLAKEISNSIHLELQPNTVGELADRPTSSALAYDLYLKSIGIEKTEGETESGTLRRKEMLERAVQIDPDFLEAWTVLKRLYALMARRVFMGRGWFLEEGEDKDAFVAEYRKKEQQALENALAIDPEHPETLLAKVVDNDWPKSESELAEVKETLELVIEKDPQNAMAWYHLGWLYSNSDPIDAVKMMEAFETALSHDPFNVRILRAFRSVCAQFSRDEKAEELEERLAQIVFDEELRRFETLHPVAQASFLWSEFSNTADTSYMNRYKTILESVAEEFSDSTRYKYPWFILHIYEGNLDKAVALAGSIDLSSSPQNDSQRLNLQHRAARALWNSGKKTEARQLSKRVLEIVDSTDFTKLPFPDEHFHPLKSIPHAILGEMDIARTLVEEIIEKRSADFDPNGESAIRTMAWVDVDRAADMALAELARDPEWPPLGGFASSFLINRQFMEHPKIQEVFVKDGKWIKHLAERSEVYKPYGGIR